MNNNFKIENMKTKRILSVLLCTICITIMTHCTQSDDIQEQIIQGDTIPQNINSQREGDGLVSSTTPTPGTWFIASRFLQEYQHLCQLQASPTYPGSMLCGPTSYLLGTHMIAQANNISYPASIPQLGTIYTRLFQAGKFDNQAGMYINDIDWYSKTYDNSIIQTFYKRTTSRVWMKEFIEYHLKTGYPVLAAIQVYGNRRSSWATNDADLYDQVGKNYYVSKNGTIGHFVLLIGNKINTDGTGTIWYKDPLAPTGVTQSASYTRILDAMKYNGNNNYYDAISLYE